MSGCVPLIAPHPMPTFTSELAQFIMHPILRPPLSCTALVRKFSHCHSRTALSNTIASIHTWLFKFKLITTSKSWESVKELGGSITLLCIPAHHTVTDNCSHGREKGLGWQDSGFRGSLQTRKAFSLLGDSPVFPPPIRVGSRYRLTNGGPVSNTTG